MKKRAMVLSFVGIVVAVITVSPHAGHSAEESQGKASGCITVSKYSPTPYSEGLSPLISATLVSDCGIAVDPKSIELIINNRPVTPVMEGTGSKITLTYTPESDFEREAKVDVTVRAKDANGNQMEKNWRFIVERPYWE